MNNQLLLVAITFIFFACKPLQSDTLTSVQYKAQTRGYSLSLEVSPKQIISIENGVKSTRKLSVDQWKSIENTLNSIDFSTIQNDLNKELTAVDRAIPAQLTIITTHNTKLVEFTHNLAPTQLKTLLKLIQVP